MGRLFYDFWCEDEVCWDNMHYRTRLEYLKLIGRWIFRVSVCVGIPVLLIIGFISAIVFALFHA